MARMCVDREARLPLICRDRVTKGGEAMQGILMTPDMIQATVDGRKTNTRRVIKPQPEIVSDSVITCLHWKGVNCGSIRGNGQDWLATQARYRVGETVYIKEAYKRWCPDGAWNVRYKDGSIKRTDVAGDPWMDDEFLVEPIKWSNARTMPAWAARHFILIEAVRAERLQGINSKRHDEVMKEGYPFGYDIATLNENPVTTFARYWNSINPAYPWDSNPWVSAYQFRLESKEWHERLTES